MKVVIWCGGLGTRMKEETEYKPKPMVPIGNQPILWHIMKIFSHYELKDFVLCLGYKGDVIKDYFLKFQYKANDFQIDLDKSPKAEICGEVKKDNWKVTLSDTGEKAQKGARLKKVEKYIDSDDFIVTYGDGVADIDLKALIDYHKSHGKIATLTGVRPPSRFGEIIVNQNNQVKSFTEKPQTSKGLINGGFIVLKKKIFDYLTTDDNCDFEKGPLNKVAEEGQLMMFDHGGTWECMDNIRDVEHLNKLWSDNKAFWKVWN